MTGLSVFFALILGFADKKLKVIDDPRIEEVSSLLPHVNCGACGYPNCHAFAEAIVRKGADPGGCRVIGEESRNELFKLLGKEKTARYPILPLVHCAAKWEHKKIDAEYKGIRTCASANVYFGGGMACEYGCIGFGDCTAACQFGALRMEDGLPKLVATRCVGCGKCAEACPRNIITIQEKKNDKLFYVACSSYDDIERVRAICKVGCIACGICEKLSPEKYFHVTDNLSHPDYSKQTNEKAEEIAKIADKCPTKVIKEI